MGATYSASSAEDQTFSGSIARNINTFGAKVLQSLATRTENAEVDATLLSSWGLAHALAMALEGAEVGSPSWKSLAEVVYGLTSPVDDGKALSMGIKSLTDELVRGSDGKVLTLSDANSAWVKPDVQLLESYVTSLRQLFSAGAFNLESASAVNGWVSENTGGKITSILDESIVRQADLILINAIYFKGLWLEAFDQRSTTLQPFHLMDGSSQQSPLMYLSREPGGPKTNADNGIQGSRFSVSVSNAAGSQINCIAARLRYKGEGGYAAIIAAPDGLLTEDPIDGRLTLINGTSYADALEACRKEVLRQLSLPTPEIQWMSPGDPESHAIKIWLPRFEVEASASLSQTLSSMGLQPIFQPGDFSRISENRRDLFISDVIQKVYIKVDEEGTEAAAATAVIMMRGLPRPRPELLLRFDRPFVFCLVHEPSQLTLFSGEIYKPETIK